MKTSARAIAASIALAAACGISAAESPPWRVADLRSFLHGTPAPQAKAAPPRQLARVSSEASVADPSIEGFMRALADAIMARDGTALLPRLSDKYAIDDLPAGFNASDLFLQAIGAIPGPTEIVVKSVERRNDARLVTAQFRYGDEGKVKTFWFDASGRLLRSDLFALQRRAFGG